MFVSFPIFFHEHAQHLCATKSQGKLITINMYALDVET